MKSHTKPQLQAVDRVLDVVTRHEDGAVLLAEARTELSLIVARRLESPDGTVLRMSECHWVLYGPKDIGILPIDEVLLGQSARGHWNARRGSDGRIVRWPSRIPYTVWFPDPDALEDLEDDFMRLRVSTALDKVITVFTTVPGFARSGSGLLMSPIDYAAVEEHQIDGALVDIPPEFRVE